MPVLWAIHHFDQCVPDDKVEDICNCEGAKKHQRRTVIYEKRRSALNRLCGEGCEETNPEYTPVSTETYTLLESLVHAVIFDTLQQASVKLPDGTTLKITSNDIERKKTVAVKLAG